ncbi:hypothetical protein BDN72DRAFT_965822 [Pluteus cervinus]|uniref:Uncharacterized protein n=1 Tax=Pluteus cervinus TaxID=181527 RepID=A0ACD3A3E3_9AGAR|nr:hypothetical protein BDN72DRAFT_965822 [Pluteus cervinus]
MTTHVCRVLSELPYLERVGFSYESGYGNPIDTLTFKPIPDSEVGAGDAFFRSLVNIHQTAPFSESSQFISSWQRSSSLIHLTVTSQTLELPEAFRSALLTFADNCPLLRKLSLACLITPYWSHPGTTSTSQLRINLDTLLPVHKFKDLRSLSISHSLPIALTDDDFLVLIKEWSKLETLNLGSDPYPFDSGVIRTASSPLSYPTTNPEDPDASITVYPILGLWKSIKSLRKQCPMLKELLLFGVDDFPSEDEQASSSEDEATPLPFPKLKSVSFSTSLLTSDKKAVALALSQYFLPDVSFASNKTWGGDHVSQYLAFLNLRPLIPLQDQFSPELQAMIESSSQDFFHPARARVSLALDMVPNEPIGVDGLIDEKTEAELDRRAELWDKVAEFVSALSKARVDERKKAKRRLIEGNVDDRIQ